MALSFSWTDYQEDADGDISALYSFDSPVSSPENLKNHLFINGDNYPALKLLENQYSKKIDIIYIDPPYNTGNNFIYEDSFKNRKDDDRHSRWLSFMQRRLTLAGKLLKDTGCIFIAIDQNELYYLKILCDQIFGEDNFINDFMWLHGKGRKDSWSRTLQQNTLCYAKNKKNLKPFADYIETQWAKTNADNDPRGNWFSGSISFTEKRSNPEHKYFYTIKSPSGIEWTRQWFVSEDEMNILLKENKIYFGQAPAFNKVPRIKIFNEEKTEIIPKNIIDCTESTRKAQEHLDKILGAKKIFENPKPVDLISHLISITQNSKNAIVMDFFAGSGTTFESVLELNRLDEGKRKCILIQKPEPTFSEKAADTNAFSNGYKDIAQICRKRIESVLDFYRKNYGLKDSIDYITLLHHSEAAANSKE